MLQTPVTSAPSDFAIWTAKVPTPPEAPLIKTFWPGCNFPVSRKPCNAVTPAICTAPACSKVMLAGFGARPRSVTQMYSAKAPVFAAKNFVAHFDLRHIFADRLDRAGEIDAQPQRLRFPQSLTETHDEGLAADEVPVVWINRSDAHFHQRLVVVRHGLGDVG